LPHNDTLNYRMYLIITSYKAYNVAVIWYICWLQLGWHPVAVIQLTFTHKQYTEQHNETEYTEQIIYNNKNT
jgi:hypothetical protein